MNLIDVINEIVDEKGLDKNVLGQIICEGILAGFEKKYPTSEFKVDYDKKNGQIEVKIKRDVVAAVEDEINEISLRKAKTFNPDAALDDEIWVPFEEKIGRVEILKARQVIATRMKDVESEAVYKAFIAKEGSIIIGNVHKLERSGASVKIQDAIAFLPKENFIPGEKIVPGYPIKALLKEVLTAPRGDYQLILDRASVDFLKTLMELEIPEIFEKIVEIKKIVREPGYKSKVLVSSNDQNIDPVGTCIGMAGSRIKPILRELAGEKIDIIAWGSSVEDVVRDALKPAEIIKVEVDKGSPIAKVWLNEDQRSVAIGRMGKNITLASKLVDLEIELIESGKKSLE